MKKLMKNYCLFFFCIFLFYSCMSAGAPAHITDELRYAQKSKICDYCSLLEVEIENRAINNDSIKKVYFNGDNLIEIKHVKGVITEGYWENIYIMIVYISEQGDVYLVGGGDYVKTQSLFEPEADKFLSDSFRLQDDYETEVNEFLYKVKMELEEMLKT